MSTSRLRLPRPLALALLAAGAFACGDAPSEPTTPSNTPEAPRAAEAPAWPGDPPPGSLWVEAVENGGFEQVADATTEPPKYGAYWQGAFVATEGDPTDLVEERDDAADGRRVLRLEPGAGPVVHKIVANVRWSERLPLALSWRGEPGSSLVVRLRDGTEDATELVLGPAGSPSAWVEVREDVGALFVGEHERTPQPRLRLELSARGGPVEVDAVRLPTALPDVAVADVTARLRREITRTLELWYLPPEEGGLGLVDPATGYMRANSYDVDTGELVQPRRQDGLHTVHVLLADWLALCRERGWVGEFERWQPRVEVIARTLLDQHFDANTKLPFGRFRDSGRPNRDQPVTVGAWIDFLLDAREVVDDPELRTRLLEQARATADTLVKLAAAHDLDPDKRPNKIKLDKSTGVFEGQYDNWFGHLPNKITPRGQIDTPRRYNTAWAIVSGRRFWYHLLKSPAAVLRVHALSPRKGDLEVVLRAVQRYERPWDAARYDLENDTDDHYGYLMEDGLTLLEAAAAARHESPLLDQIVARTHELVYGATDHRLDPASRRADDTLWVQAVRLGTACAGDSPRAFIGLSRLISHAPTDPRVPLHREALRELTANDFRGRQLTNGQFTESFFKDWEMIAICYSGPYQGDCRERPWEEWQGDVGDVFGGPPLSSLLAQAHAWKLAARDRRQQALARFLTILDAADRDLRRPYGYLFGLDPEVARQYGLPPRYTEGLDPHTAAGLGTITALLDTLEILTAEG